MSKECRLLKGRNEEGRNEEGRKEEGAMNDKANQLEERLVDFAVLILGVVESLPDTRIGNHIAGQLVRCGTSPGPNYGEAQSAESRNDFIHKMKVALKELRETLIWLKIIIRKGLGPSEDLAPILQENDELISIFVTSVKTAQHNRNDGR